MNPKNKFIAFIGLAWKWEKYNCKRISKTVGDQYLLDDGSSFSNIELLILHIHAAREYLTSLMDVADANNKRYLQVRGHVLSLNTNSDYQKFRPRF